MVQELDLYRGDKRTRHHYTEFRNAKRQLYALRPDIAPQIMRFVVASTHWRGTKRASKQAQAIGKTLAHAQKRRR